MRGPARRAVALALRAICAPAAAGSSPDAVEITALRHPVDQSGFRASAMSFAALFVRTGNICRSPTVEGVLRRLAERERPAIRVESRGTHDYHVGEPPDE